MTAEQLHITQGNVVIHDGAEFALDGGTALQPATVRYTIYGEPNAAADNVLLVCHALSGSSEVHTWWPELLYTAFDLERDCVVCTNVLGSCYGSTGPTSFNTQTGKPYGPTFPLVTIRDMVRAQALALEQLGIRRLKAVLGGSIGGMQALQWAIDFPERVERCIAIGMTASSAMALAFNHLQREAIALDPNWRGGNYETLPANGVALARQIAMCSYKSAELLDERHGRAENRKGPSPYASAAGKFDVAGYLEHQGEKFVARFDANSYVAITRAMDRFDPAREYGSDVAAFSRIRAHCTLVGISSDWLFPPRDVERFAKSIRDAGAVCDFHELVSSHGHDGFLADCDRLVPVLRDALSKSSKNFLQNPGDLHANRSGSSCHNRTTERPS